VLWIEGWRTSAQYECPYTRDWGWKQAPFTKHYSFNLKIRRNKFAAFSSHISPRVTSFSNRRQVTTQSFPHGTMPYSMQWVDWWAEPGRKQLSINPGSGMVTMCTTCCNINKLRIFMFVVVAVVISKQQSLCNRAMCLPWRRNCQWRYCPDIGSNGPRKAQNRLRYQRFESRHTRMRMWFVVAELTGKARSTSHLSSWYQRTQSRTCLSRTLTWRHKIYILSLSSAVHAPFFLLMNKHTPLFLSTFCESYVHARHTIECIKLAFF
jgi:hypothetical protein